MKNFDSPRFLEWLIIWNGGSISLAWANFSNKAVHLSLTSLAADQLKYESYYLHKQQRYIYLLSHTSWITYAGNPKNIKTISFRKLTEIRTIWKDTIYCVSSMQEAHDIPLILNIFGMLYHSTNWLWYRFHYTKLLYPNKIVMLASNIFQSNSRIKEYENDRANGQAYFVAIGS